MGTQYYMYTYLITVLSFIYAYNIIKRKIFI